MIGVPEETIEYIRERGFHIQCGSVPKDPRFPYFRLGGSIAYVVGEIESTKIAVQETPNSDELDDVIFTILKLVNNTRATQVMLNPTQPGEPFTVYATRPAWKEVTDALKEQYPAHQNI